ncbi:MAG: GH3 auxin-responsive promoter family protein [Deltaproteobacteria bacterium]|nr:GH3 auxin-responsive promoter family protein [Deltaproteobacteria bacterium]
MRPEDKFFRISDDAKIWQKYCGFLDLSLEEFMEMQEHLLLDEIELVANSPLGRKIMQNQKPSSVDEFRKVVPLTTYEDYAPYLGQQNEDALAVKPHIWAHTSGAGGTFKWVPLTERSLDIWVRNGIAMMILASASSKGEVNIQPGIRLFHNTPPRPYGSAIVTYAMAERFSMQDMPPLEESEMMAFPQKIEKGVSMALLKGIDVIYSLSSVLVKIGEGLGQRSGERKFSLAMLHPALLFRIIRAKLRAKREGRAMLPRDLWNPRAVLCAGTDTSIYRDKIAYYWGKTPCEFYVFTEGGPLALEGWNRKGLVFIPDLGFLEFIPEKEWCKSREDKEYQPPTVLLNELEEGKTYEVVTTNFHGMPFLRYRPGDLLRVVALRDEETGCQLPQMVFAGRVGDIIDVLGIARLDERTVWHAIAGTGVDFEDWTMRKEQEEGKPVIHLYIELKQGEKRTAEELRYLVNEQIRVMDRHYKEATTDLEPNPLRVSLLPQGSFQRYFEEKKKEGASMAHLKPTHMCASDEVMEKLLHLSKGG